MKKSIRAIMLSASALAFVTAPAVSTQVFAQDAAAATPAAQTQCASPDKEKLYTQDFRTNYKGTDQQQETTNNAAKQYIERFGSCEEDKEIVAYLQKWTTKYEEGKKKANLYKSFNEAVQAKNHGGVITIGKQILASEPENVAVILYIVDNGFSAAQKKDDTYNTDTINYAKQSIDKTNANKTPEGGKYQPFTDKDDALAWANYTIGYINANRLNDKTEAAPYFYKATQFDSPIKTSYYPYLMIGSMYLDQYTKAADEYTNKFKDDTGTDEAKQAAGMWKAYADRAAEYYARAYSYAKADAKTKPEVTKDLNDTLTQLYKLRHNNETTGMDAFVASFNGKPATDPTSAVTPVIETTPSTATTTSISSSASSNEATTSNRASSSSAAAIGQGNEAGAKATATTGTTKTNTAAKKPAPRKKS